jgi:hypothetical protein
MRKLLFLTMCLLLAGGSALAGKSIQAEKLDDFTIQEINLGGESGSRQDCYLGNLESGYWAISGWFTGAEEYKYLFWPGEQCFCPLGFQISTVHMLLQFTVPVSFLVVVDQEDGIWIDPCWYPGEVDCVSSTYQVDITAAGVYDIGIPLDGCQCSYMYWATPVPGFPWGPYLISFHFPELFTANLITDNTPTPCVAFNNWGSGWADLWDYGFSGFGDIVMYAEADCCEFPVSAEESTWGHLKGLYK